MPECVKIKETGKGIDNKAKGKVNPILKDA